MKPNLYGHTDGHMMEQMVADLLRIAGFVILEQNFKIGHIEIDIIALEGDTLCFIEVKSRSFPIRVEELDSVISFKQRNNIINAADIYCRNIQNINYSNVRFDYALIHVPQNAPPKVQYIRSAFTPTHWVLQ